MPKAPEPPPEEETLSALTLSKDTWAGFLRNNEGRWEFQDSFMEMEDAASVARLTVISAYASGTHPVLVVNVEGAYEYRVTVETEEVTGG